MINVQIVYALPEKPTIINCSVDDDATALNAIEKSAIIALHQLDINSMQIGIYGNKVSLETKLKNEDRIEIYRPLINDPKEIRRQRALNNKKRA